MVNRERQIIQTKAECLDDLDYMTLGRVAKYITQLSEKYGPDARIEQHEDRYDDHSRLYVVIQRPETDAEMKYRISREEYYQKINEEREREDYERLQKKFGKGN